MKPLFYFDWSGKIWKILVANILIATQRKWKINNQYAMKIPSSRYTELITVGKLRWIFSTIALTYLKSNHIVVCKRKMKRRLKKTKSHFFLLICLWKFMYKITDCFMINFNNSLQLCKFIVHSLILIEVYETRIFILLSRNTKDVPKESQNIERIREKRANFKRTLESC